MRTARSTYFLSWLWALSFVGAVLWVNISTTPLPFPGLRNLSESEFGVPMSLFLLAAATWLSLPRLVSRDSLLFFRGVSTAFAVIGFLFTSVPFGLACAFLAHSTRPALWSQ